MAIILTIALSGALPGAMAAAQAAPTPGAIILDRNRIDRAVVPLAPAAPPPRPVTTVAAQAPGTPIRGIRFAGAAAPAPVARAAERFLGKPATKETLGALATALGTAYADSDVALYSVAIPDQKFADGVVTVVLTEGRIAKLQVRSDDPRAHPQLKRRMAPLATAGPLPRTTFERAFTLMRAVPGLTVTPDFADPAGNGALVLTVTPKQKRSKVTAGFSNRGVRLLGDGQFDVRGEAYGALIDGDQLSVAASAATDLKRYRYASAGYAAPIGGDGLTASASAAYLETRPRGLPVTGTAKQAALALGYPLIRGFRRSADVSLGFDGIDSDNAAFGTVIATERTRAVRLAASAADTRPRRAVSGSIALSKGVDVFGARVTAPLADATFTKATASLSVAQAIGSRLTARVSASGQYSRDALPAAERFAIGGEAIGRAFDTALLSGDRGGGALGELAWRPLKNGGFAASELYGFVDAGEVTVVPRGPLAEQHYTLASTGAGVRARLRDKAELGLEVARTIDDPYPGYDEDWRLSVAWRLSL